MLQLRKEQYESLEEAQFERFVASMVIRLRRRLPDKTHHAADEHLSDFIKVQIDRAEKHGITDCAYLREYIELAMDLGPQFDQALPWATAILKRDILTQRDKVAWLTEYRTFRDPDNGNL